MGEARNPSDGALREPVQNSVTRSQGFDSVRNPPFPQRFAPRTLRLGRSVGWVKHGTPRMVRCANRSRTAIGVFKGSTPCVTHHFPSGSLHAPYRLDDVGWVKHGTPRWCVARTGPNSVSRFPEFDPVRNPPFPQRFASTHPTARKTRQSYNPELIFENTLLVDVPIVPMAAGRRR